MKYFLLLLIIITGCAGSCLKFGGGYKDFKGDIEWCFNAKKSQETGRPVFTNKEGEDIVSLTGLDIETILKMVKDKGKELIGIKSVKEEAPQPPAKELLDRIRKYKE